jgi:hypothetical protein
MNNRRIKGRPGIVKGKFQPAINQIPEDKVLENKQKIETTGSTTPLEQKVATTDLKQGV